MEILKFTLSGGKATFTRPYFNSYYSTYSHIHKVALLGILGAVIGIGKEKAVDGVMKFYDELESLKVSIVPHRVQFPEVKNTVTETTGMYNNGNTYVSDYMELVNPSWDIYVDGEDNPHFEKIKEYILGKKSIYSIYLGKNHHFASIENPVLLTGEVIDEADRIHSLFKAEDVLSEPVYGEEDTTYYFKESFPVAMDRTLNQYELSVLALTNEKMEWISEDARLIHCDSKNLYLI